MIIGLNEEGVIDVLVAYRSGAWYVYGVVPSRLDDIM